MLPRPRAFGTARSWRSSWAAACDDPRWPALTVGHVQQRDGRWCIVDLVGKHGRVRTIPVPTWVKVAMDAWTSTAGVADGFIFRPLNITEQVHAAGLSEKVVWQFRRPLTLPASTFSCKTHRSAWPRKTPASSSARLLKSTWQAGDIHEFPPRPTDGAEPSSTDPTALARRKGPIPRHDRIPRPSGTARFRRCTRRRPAGSSPDSETPRLGA